MTPAPMKDLLERVRIFLDGHRRLVRYAAVFALLALIGLPISRLIPRGADLHYDLGDGHAVVREVRIAYVPVGGESARAITVRFPDGAPRHYVHHVELAPGRYEVHARLTGADVDQMVTRYVDIPQRADDAEIQLYERPLFGF